MLLVGALALGGGLGVHWQLAAQEEPRLSPRALLLTLVVALAFACMPALASERDTDGVWAPACAGATVDFMQSP